MREHHQQANQIKMKLDKQSTCLKLSMYAVHTVVTVAEQIIQDLRGKTLRKVDPSDNPLAYLDKADSS